MTISEVSTKDLWYDLMQFYTQEAWLLDERKFKQWLNIFTEDVFYFIPRRKNVYRKDLSREITKYGDLAILEESKRDLQMRIARLDTGMAWAEDPPSRTRHIIANLVVEPLENGEVKADGGRVLSITAKSDKLENTLDKIYNSINLIEWPHGYFRKDIGFKAVKR